MSQFLSLFRFQSDEVQFTGISMREQRARACRVPRFQGWGYDYNHALEMRISYCRRLISCLAGCGGRNCDWRSRSRLPITCSLLPELTRGEYFLVRRIELLGTNYDSPPCNDSIDGRVLATSICVVEAMIFN